MYVYICVIVIGGWMEKMYKYTAVDVHEAQLSLEKKSNDHVINLEQVALKQINNNNDISELITQFSLRNSADSLTQWTNLLNFLITKYHGRHRDT